MYEISEFSILPYTHAIPKIKNSEISEISLLFQILTVVVTQDLKKKDELRQNVNRCVMV